MKNGIETILDTDLSGFKFKKMFNVKTPDEHSVETINHGLFKDQGVADDYIRKHKDKEILIAVPQIILTNGKIHFKITAQEIKKI